MDRRSHNGKDKSAPGRRPCALPRRPSDDYVQQSDIEVIGEASDGLVAMARRALAGEMAIPLRLAGQDARRIQTIKPARATRGGRR